MKQIETKRSRKSVTSVADYIGAQLAHLPPGKTQKSIAEALGYDKPNIIVMFKKGDTKLPVTKVPALAKELGVDPMHLLRMTLSEYTPEILAVIESLSGTFISANERELVKLWRRATKETDPSIELNEHKSAINAVGADVAKLEIASLKHAQDDMRLKQDGLVKTKPNS